MTGSEVRGAKYFCMCIGNKATLLATGSNICPQAFISLVR